MHENLLPLISATENDEEITLDRQSAMAFMNCVKKAVLLVGDVSAVLTAQRRAQVLTKLIRLWHPWLRTSSQTPASNSLAMGLKLVLKPDQRLHRLLLQPIIRKKCFFQ